MLVSGAGTNLQALLDACRDPAYGAAVVAVGADRDDIEGLARAERAGIPTFVHRVEDHRAAATGTPRSPRPSRRTSRTWSSWPGFMKLVGATFLSASAAGRSTPTRRSRRRSRACTGPQDALAYGVKVTGCTLFVVDEGVDTGPIVAQSAVPVEDDDSVESLHERIKVAERAMLVDTVGRMAREGWTIDGRRVRLGG